MRAAALELEQGRFAQGRLIKLARMLRDELAKHFQMTEFLERLIPLVPVALNVGYLAYSMSSGSISRRALRNRMISMPSPPVR